MLAELYLHPGEEYSLKELAKLVGVSSPTILRDVERLVDSDFLKDRRQGRSRLIKANAEHPIYQQLADVVLFGYGPMAILPDILAEIAEVEEAWIFGSWAARYQGEPVGQVGDLDVVVIGTPSRTELYRASSTASRQLRVEASFHPLSRAQWKDEGDPFVASILERPRLKIELKDEDV